MQNTPNLTHIPIDPPRRVSRRVAVGIAAACIAVIGLWFLGTPSGINGKLSAIGYAICHQIEERSFLINGNPMPLCARCTGIYLGVVTAFLLFQISGRGKAAKLPRGWVAFFLSVFVVLMGIDGANSYLHLFPGAPGIYEPHNTLRVITGILCGFAIFNGIYPVFNAVVWADPRDDQFALANLRELAGCLAILAFLVLLVLSDGPLFRTLLAFASIFGVVLMLTMIGSVIFVTLLKLENTFSTLRSLAVPIMAGLLITFIEIGGIDALRLFLTGTWAGLKMPG
jgi:uncharacterized membrane protein